MAAKVISDAARVTPARNPFQQGLEDNSLVDYYDIMVIGRTGMGKSATVDKLLIAKLPGMEHPASNNQEPVSHQSPDGKQLLCRDLTMWLISNKDFEMDKVSMRLKNLVFFRSVENSHKEVNSSRESDMHIYESTHQCELLSNETTKIRVLDVPGFYGRDAAGEERDLDKRALAAQDTDLSMMRKILHIKSAHSLNFNRVVYFLPDKGCLKRTSDNLIMEIAIMERYFGRTIFDNMVVIATLPAEVYEHIDESANLFSAGQHEKTKSHFQEALQKIFRGCGDVPEPSIIFISLFDTCEHILDKVQGAPVKHDHIQLELSKSLCSRCGVTIVKEGKEEAEAAKCIDECGSIPAEESTCHPMLIPKHSKVVRMLGGIGHLVTFGIFKGFVDEVCLSCKRPPGTRGCEKIGNVFSVGKEEIIVQHSTSIFEPYQVVNEDGTPFQLPKDVGPGEVSPNSYQHGHNHYVYPDGKIKQELSPQDISPSDCSSSDFSSSNIKGT